MTRTKQKIADEPTPPPVTTVDFRDRVQGLIRIRAGELKANPKNWRLHPEAQRGAFRTMLQDIGFVGALIARKTSDGYELLDGHMRTEEIADEAEIPVLIVDLDDAEASKLLATYDPLGDMALFDSDQLSKLLESVDTEDNAELRRIVADLEADVIKEHEQKEERPHEIQGMALQPHEHYDYLVVLASGTQEWNVLCERLALKPAAKRRGSMGTARAVRASDLLAKLPQ